MAIIQQIAFVLLASISIALFTKKIKELIRNISLGQAVSLPGTTSERVSQLVLLAFGQKKMFANLPVAVMHFILYAGFIIINIEVVEIVLDGILGTHRLFAPSLGGLYTFLINTFEILAFLVLVACVAFLIRRNVMKISRFQKPELNGWPRSDANFILITEIVLMGLFITMNALDANLQKVDSHYTGTGTFYISGLMAPLFGGLGSGTIVVLERTCWWLHIVGIFAFLNYLPYSKHLHIFMAFPNSYYNPIQPAGVISNMPVIQNEVLYAMQPELIPADASTPNKFGANDVTDLTWKNLLDAYSCTECGRCTDACPANQTGKALNPRKIMMDTRDRLEEVGNNINKNGSFVPDNKSLLHNYITTEELKACTTCNACVQACPVSINPVNIIMALRRYLILDESNSPAEWNNMSNNIENNGAPWQFSPADRDKWATEVV